jgi:hypothetical protein
MMARVARLDRDRSEWAMNVPAYPSRPVSRRGQSRQILKERDNDATAFRPLDSTRARSRQERRPLSADPPAGRKKARLTALLYVTGCRVGEMGGAGPPGGRRCRDVDRCSIRLNQGTGGTGGTVLFPEHLRRGAAARRCGEGAGSERMA